MCKYLAFGLQVILSKSLKIMAEAWSMMAAIAALVMFVTVPLYMTDGAWQAIGSIYRNGRKRVLPAEATCARLFWSDLLQGELHRCTHIFGTQCHDIQHLPGNTCWRKSISLVLNNAQPQAKVEKPECLPLQKEFLCVDWNTIRAFMFMAIDKDYQVNALKNGKDIDQGKIKLRFQLMKRRNDVRMLLVHIHGSLQRTVTKEHMLRLLQGDPPLLRDPRTYSISTDADLKRGGWVVALGLDNNLSVDTAFVPIYMDTIEYSGRRGGVFWRSIDRVSEIVEENFLPSFPASRTAIVSALQALEYMKTRETESGVDGIFSIATQRPPLSPQECQDVIDVFNGPPKLSAQEREALERKFASMVEDVLIAVVRGTRLCVSYCKNPGRELDRMIPKDILEFNEVYVCGC
jgi:hypothetical protein